MDSCVQWLKGIVWCGGIRPLAVMLRREVFSVSLQVHKSQGESDEIEKYVTPTVRV